MPRLQLFNGSYRSGVSESCNIELVNMRIVDTSTQGRSRYVAIPSAGSVELVDLGGNSCRGIIKIGDYWYTVVDNKVYKLSINIISGTCDSSTLLGTISTTTGSVKMTYNSTQLIILDKSTAGYIVTLATGALTAIADVDFQGGSSVVYLDGYFIYNPVDTALLKSSAIDDGMTWNSLDVASAEQDPDNVVTLAISRGEVWVFGKKSAEIWYDSANATGFPFSPRIGLGLSIGCSAPDSVVSINDSLIWLDNRGFIVQSTVSNYMRNQSSGYALNPISNEALQSEIAKYTTINNAVACQILEGGKLFYQITFPSEHITWVCDISLIGNQSGISPWFQRGTYSDYYGDIREHVLQYTDLADEQTVVGCGYNSGKIYLLKSNVYTDDGEAIHRKISTAPVHSEGNIIECSKVELVMGTGYATADGAGSDPKVSMRYSIDGGHAWSSYIERSMGLRGEYGKPILWSGLGSGRMWTWEFTTADPVNFSIIELSANISADSDE